MEQNHLQIANGIHKVANETLGKRKRKRNDGHMLLKSS